MLLGSDGRRYMFLAKPQDDLRKDSRMMEVAGVVNHLFTGQPASRRRNLYLRRRAWYMWSDIHRNVATAPHVIPRLFSSMTGRPEVAGAC